jgi:hypothetical protein
MKVIPAVEVLRSQMDLIKDFFVREAIPPERIFNADETSTNLFLLMLFGQSLRPEMILAGSLLFWVPMRKAVCCHSILSSNAHASQPMTVLRS